jgi:adenylylsulfate kinase-like enzyme
MPGMVEADVIPVLWLCGPSGVGKSTIGWRIRQELDGAAFVDIDQLGMCYPEPPTDPGLHRLKAENLRAVLDGFRAAGARCAVVSGVVDPGLGVHADLIPNALLTVIRLRVDRDDLAVRLAGRPGDTPLSEDLMAEATGLDSSTFADAVVDTTGLSVAEVVDLVREAIGSWPSQPSERRAEQASPPAAEGPVLWICGPTGVGKSAVTFDVYMRVLRSGAKAAYIDLDQIGFYNEASSDHRLKAHNVAAMWRIYRAAGAEVLHICGPVESVAALDIYAALLPDLTVCRLNAQRPALTDRILLRGRGSGWSQPGDPLLGRPVEQLLDVVDGTVAANDVEIGDVYEVCDVCIDTDALNVAEVADAVVARTGWAGL